MRKTRSNRSNRNVRVFQSDDCCVDEGMVDTDCSNLKVYSLDSKRLHQFWTNRLSSFCAESLDSLWGVITGESGEIHTLDRM